MEVQIIMLVCSLLIPLMMLIFGWIMLMHPPKEPNSVFGYRTAASGRSQESWLYAQKLCGKIWLILGFAMLVVSFACFLLPIWKDENGASVAGAVMMGVQTALMLLSIIPVEVALHRNFDSEGKRKE